MTHDEAVKIVRLNYDKLNGSMQAALNYLLLEAEGRRTTCARLAGIFRERLEGELEPGHTTGLYHYTVVDTLTDVIGTIEEYADIRYRTKEVRRKEDCVGCKHIIEGECEFSPRLPDDFPCCNYEKEGEV